MNKDDGVIEKKAYQLVSIGISKWRSGDLDGALKNHLNAIELLKSRTPHIWYKDDSYIVEDVGHIFRALGEYDKAIKFYEEAWGKANHLLIANVYYENLKDYKKASEIYLSLLFLSNDPYYSSAAFNLANMAWKGEGQQQSLINALMWMQVAHLMNPKSDGFINAMGKLKNEMNAKDIESAVLLCDEYLKKRNENIEKLLKDPWSNVTM